MVFLGVDETLQANALEKLSNYLDNNLKIDWVVGNTIVMNLDKNNYYKNDVMKHIRDGAKKSLHILKHATHIGLVECIENQYTNVLDIMTVLSK